MAWSSHIILQQLPDDPQLALARRASEPEMWTGQAFPESRPAKGLSKEPGRRACISGQNPASGRLVDKMNV